MPLQANRPRGPAEAKGPRRKSPVAPGRGGIALNSHSRASRARSLKEGAKTGAVAEDSDGSRDGSCDGGRRRFAVFREETFLAACGMRCVSSADSVERDRLRSALPHPAIFRDGRLFRVRRRGGVPERVTGMKLLHADFHVTENHGRDLSRQGKE